MSNRNEETGAAQDVNEMMKIRRDKLQTFADMGVAPFGHRYEVTHHAQDIRDHFDELEQMLDKKHLPDQPQKPTVVVTTPKKRGLFSQVLDLFKKKK